MDRMSEETDKFTILLGDFSIHISMVNKKVERHKQACGRPEKHNQSI